ncbi:MULTISPECIES: ABC transporter permease [Oceanobacillus]|uniref:ABC transporter permease n=1 Tax=Oceanobacillus profundus TaxID=372463 RepID=A0A417YHQ5_9BACI|nr:ABC transporter permease [Oceanobacillus profundus]MBR3118071.1 ABC transporter permease [Oceanobacillus sp.]PAE28433.1 ABC transporter [Paenibacillus sp. 7884-2]RHW32484.1 ABC transporter permease [Oceanobacillus profundus]
MTFSMKRVMAIFQKDMKDLYKNMYVSTTILMPLIFAFFYGRMDNLTVEVHYVVINLTLAIVTAFLQCSIIAEEKEKNTLRGLMLSPATIPEILGGKSLVTFILTVITIILCAMLTGYEPANMGIVAIAIIVSSLFYIALGTLMGLISRTLMEASVLILPVMFIFGFGSMFRPFAEEYPILSVIDYLPNIQLIELATAVEAGSGFGDVLGNLGIIAAWVVVGMIATVIVFKKRELDE